MKKEHKKTIVKNTPSIEVVASIMDRAMEIDKDTSAQCRDFRIMTSTLREKILILRWTTIDIGDIDRPKQSYRYECFEMDGTPQHCSIHYSNQEEANAFFLSLETLYAQECSVDHKL